MAVSAPINFIIETRLRLKKKSSKASKAKNRTMTEEKNFFSRRAREVSRGPTKGAKLTCQRRESGGGGGGMRREKSS
jgi:hypothetical protein